MKKIEAFNLKTAAKTKIYRPIVSISVILYICKTLLLKI